MKHKSIKLSIIFLLFCELLLAQSQNSVYSMFGVGKMVDHNYGINRALGGTGIAFRSGQSINFKNPASYLGLNPNAYVMELGAYGFKEQAESKNMTQLMNNMNISYFGLGFYVNPRWAMTIGILPFSDINYEVTTTNQVEGELSTYEKDYIGSGGLNRINIGNSFHIQRGLTAGFNLSYIFGSVSLIESAADIENFEDFELKNERVAKGLYLDYGLQYSFMQKSDYLYTIGLIYGASTSLSTTDNKELYYDDATTELDPVEGDDLKVPMKFGLGVALNKGKNFKIGFDYEFKNWAAITFDSNDLNTRNSNRFSFGTEFGNSKQYNRKYYENIVYRMGGFYQQSYLQIDNVPINSHGFNVGIGLPINKVNMLNISLEYGQEGTLENNLVKNTYWGMYFNFSLYEFVGKGLF